MKATVNDSAKDVDPVPLNTDGITMWFDEPATVKSGNVIIKPEGGLPLDWKVERTSDMMAITIVPMEGQELVNGTTYIIELYSVTDMSGGASDIVITFSTKEEN